MTASEVRPQPRPCCLRLLAYLADYGRRRAPVARKPGTRQRGNRPDRPHAGQIPRGEYACAQMRGDVDAGQPRMRNGAAHECDLAHSRQADVADILATAVQKAIILLAEKPRANRFSVGCQKPTPRMRPMAARRHALGIAS